MIQISHTFYAPVNTEVSAYETNWEFKLQNGTFGSIHSNVSNEVTNLAGSLYRFFQ